MRITREHVPQAPESTPRISLPILEGNTLWLGMALVGVALVVAPPFISAAVVGVVLVGIGCHRLGVHDARRGGPSQDPRVGGLSRGLAEVQQLLAQLLRDDGPAPAVRGDAPPAPAVEPRPAGRVRGGGRPGSIGSIPGPDPLDAALPGESTGDEGEAR